MAVLRQLRQESEPISLLDLLKKLRNDFSERSVRRWLSKLSEEGVIKKIGQKRGTKYIAAQGQDIFNEEVSSCFSSSSTEAVQQVLLHLFECQPVPYNIEWLQSYQPNKTYHLPTPVKSSEPVQSPPPKLKFKRLLGGSKKESYKTLFS